MTAEVMGVDRLVFGSDYPSFDFVRALRSVRESGLSPEQIALILGGNAKQLVRL
jgi:predicted TIM-barrel fold metal-dependent hydrolase